uniref:Putative TPR-repeat-containing chaperone protein DNAJ n=1 Tax=Trypanosoma congolense (strain IL3000) TaxID=1068625 RepID=G0UKR1_TRYCI|nr:putative TPR-repeat-containing chaperone protein DNAJ [Trypanosoma congolense IL3000]
MSGHIQLPLFAGTVTGGHTTLPRIVGERFNRDYATNLSATQGRSPMVHSRRSETLNVAGSSYPPKRQLGYREKANKELNKVTQSRSDSGATKFSSAALWQAVNEEGTFRQFLIANEAIERKRLVRSMGGKSIARIISSVDMESRGMQLLSNRDYAGAYVCFSRIIKQCPNSKIAYRKRALCDWRLLLFDECIEDCRKVVDTDADLLSLLCRSLILRDRYQEARRWYEHGLKVVAPSTSDPHNIRWSAEHGAIPAVQKFRLLVEEKKWSDAISVADAARPLIDDTPLILMEARALLHAFPDTARTRLMAYIPTIIRPISYKGDVSFEEQAVWRSVNEHYLHASVVLAQANVYCGSEYLELAAALIKTCLSLSPGFGPALLLGHYLVSLEEILVQISNLFAQKKYVDAIPHINNGLSLDKSNRLMCAYLYCMRAEVHAHCGKYSNALNDCSAAIDADGSYAKAYACRAEVHQRLGCRAEAAQDRLTAVKLDPELRHILHGNEEQSLPRADGDGCSKPPLGPKKTIPRWYDAFLPRDEFSDANFGKPRKEASPPANCPPEPTTTVTLYDALELPCGANVDEVRTQYKKLTLKYHPDRVIGQTESAQQVALEKFKHISKAHEVLSNPEEKLLYDVSIGITVPILI